MSKKINRNDPCWCGSGRKYKVCHEMFDDKIAKIAHQGHIVPTHNLIKNAEQIADRSPMELFAEFFEERSGEKLAEEDRTLVEQMMRELLEGGES